MTWGRLKLYKNNSEINVYHGDGITNHHMKTAYVLQMAGIRVTDRFGRNKLPEGKTP